MFGISLAFICHVMKACLRKKGNYAHIMGSCTHRVHIVACYVSIFLLSLSMPLSYGAIGKKGKIPVDQLAWQSLLPEIEVFWHEYQTSPHKVAQDVWPFIAALKEFIKRYPDSSKIPEAYYILGEAYAAASYWPEATAHWRIVIRYYPDSKWTSAALNSLVAYLEKQGDQKRLKRFYKEILRQFPDSVAAKTTRVLLAKQALEEGKVALVSRVIKGIERSSPMADVQIPELLDLKAGIALRQGRASDAIKLWIHFINLKKSPVARASALFKIAETYRGQGDWLKARKYYALIRRDFSTQPEALFARFRILQMKEIQQARLARYVKGGVRQVNLNDSERVFQEIVEKYPRYSLTQEVRKELIATKIKKAELINALELADDFIRTNPQSPFVHDVLKLAEEARQRLLKGEFRTEKLEAFVDAGRTYLEKKAKNKVQRYIKEVTQKLWVRLVEQLLEGKRPLKALKDYWSYKEAFRGNEPAQEEILPFAVKALEATDRWFFGKKRYSDLINYDFFHQKGIEALRSPVHYHFLAKAYSKIDLDKMSLRSYFKAWRQGPVGTEKCEILKDWTAQGLKAAQTVIAQDTTGLLDMTCPDYALLPKILYYKSKIASTQGDWIAAFNMAKDSLAGKPTEESAYQAMLAGIKLGQWKGVDQLYKRYGELLPKEKKIQILKQWGDEAVRLSEYKVAMIPYGYLSNMDKDDPSTKFRLAVARSGAFGFEQAAPVWEALSKEDQGLWGKAAKSELSFYKFMSGPAGQL